MKLKTTLCIIPIALLTIGVAQAKSDIFYKVPFHNVEVKPASKIYANYNFNAHTQTIVCQASPPDDAITSIEWSYKDATRKIDLPVKLHDEARVQNGHYADPEGKLVITNEFGSSSETGSIFVSCDYQKIN